VRTNVRQSITILAATGLLLASFAGVAAAGTPNMSPAAGRVTISVGVPAPFFPCYGLPTPRSGVPCRI
jgi:hypothetical protein